MTPSRRLDADLVQQKLERMQRAVAGLRRQQPVTADRLEADEDYAAVVERYLTQLVDLAVAINAHVAAATGDTVPGDYQATFDAAAHAGAIDEELAAQLRPSVGLRNVLIHAYEHTDVHVVAWAANDGVAHYEAYIRQVSGFAARGGAAGTSSEADPDRR